MSQLSNAKTSLLLALIHFNDQCKKDGQNGLISTGIAEVIKEANSEEEIKFIVDKLK